MPAVYVTLRRLLARGLVRRGAALGGAAWLRRRRCYRRKGGMGEVAEHEAERETRDGIRSLG